MFTSIGYEAILGRSVWIIREEASKHPDLLDLRMEEEIAEAKPALSC